MSKITQIQDAIYTVLATVLPSHKKLVNPYLPEENNERFLRLGYGVAVGAAFRQDLEICRMGSERSFIVTLSRLVPATDHDLNAKIEVEQAILEDHHLVRMAFETNATLNGTAVRTNYDSDNGIEYVASDQQRYFILQMNILVLYQETYS